MAKKFSTLRARMSSDAQARSSAHTEAMLLEMGLQELRKSRHMTQVELASLLKIDQAAVSKTESRPDMYVSTLREYIRAMGGDLQLVAKFPDAEVKLNGIELASRGRKARDVSWLNAPAKFADANENPDAGIRITQFS